MVVTGVVMVTVMMVMARCERRHREQHRHNEKQRQKLFHGRDYKDEISSRKSGDARGTTACNKKSARPPVIGASGTRQFFCGRR
jgi:hypothetical protein